MRSGTLKGSPFLQLLENVLRQTVRGRVTFSFSGNIKTLFFEDRAITGASSNDPSDYLGQYLINEGVINLEQFNRAYQTQLETDVRMAQILQLIGLAPVDKLREAIVAKTIDTAFLVSSWQDGSWEIDETYPKAASSVEIKISPRDLTTSLTKRQEEFLRIIEMFRALGDKPEVAVLDRDLSKLSKVDQQLVNLLLVGKTLREAIAALPAHFYVTSRHLLALHRNGILQRGAGKPIDEGEIFLNFIAASGVEAPHDIEAISEKETATLYRAAHEAMEKKNFWKAISHFRALVGFNPHNIVFKDALNNAEYHYILHFYKEIFEPTARIKRGTGTGTIDDTTEKKVLDLLGEGIFTVRDIVGYFHDKFPEVRILFAIEQLSRKRYLTEVK